MTPRRFLAAGAAGVFGLAGYRASMAEPSHAGKALIAITLDLEMSRNFPRWADTHWDYEKGNLDDAKKYTVGVCKRVKAAGGVVHLFVVGRLFEQADVGWLKDLAPDGHPIGNHTYDHVNVLATKPEDIQFRFQRAPWLIEGRTPEQVIVENIRLATAALKSRIGVDPAGFRTPGGFANGLADRPDVRKWLRDQGFTWVSSKYPAHPMSKPFEEPAEDMLKAIVAAQEQAQPFRYPDGLIEVPMSPVSDIGTFRNGRWRLDWFLTAVRRAAEAVIAKRQVFDLLAHPSCLGIVDPEFKAVELLIDLVKRSDGKAVLTGLDAVAERAGT
ncbi:MAG TPA: polysaccharide deacetylase family protein [Gemmataceae bacterium]|nr:polysaccharide deacetylase family protein [Gemmataceae bacterium]